MYQWCGFKSRRGKNKNLTALKSVWFNFQTYIYIVGTNCALIANNPLHFHIIDVCKLAMARSIDSLKWLHPVYISVYQKWRSDTFILIVTWQVPLEWLKMFPHHRVVVIIRFVNISCIESNTLKLLYIEIILMAACAERFSLFRNQTNKIG